MPLPPLLQGAHALRPAGELVKAPGGTPRLLVLHALGQLEVQQHTWMCSCGPWWHWPWPCVASLVVLRAGCEQPHGLERRPAWAVSVETSGTSAEMRVCSSCVWLHLLHARHGPARARSASNVPGGCRCCARCVRVELVLDAALGWHMLMIATLTSDNQSFRGVSTGATPNSAAAPCMRVVTRACWMALARCNQL